MVRYALFASSTLTAVLCLTLISSFSLPNGSQNHSLFLTNIACSKPELGLCSPSTNQVREGLESSGGATIVSDNSTRERMADQKWVEIGILNNQNVQRPNSSYIRSLRLDSLLLSEDIVASQLRIFSAHAIAAVLGLSLALAAIGSGSRRWFVLSMASMLVLGDTLANIASLAPIGLATVFLVSGVSVVIAVSQPDRLLVYRVPHLALITILVAVFGSLVAIRRIDQFLVMFGTMMFVLAASLHKGIRTNGIHSLGTLASRLGIVGTAMLPGVALVLSDSETKNLTVSAFSSIPSSESQPSSHVLEVIKQFGYYSLDLWPSWSGFSESTIAIAERAYAIGGGVVILLLGLSFIRLKPTRWAGAAVLLGSAWISIYGTLVGPRAEFRYAAPLFATTLYWGLVTSKNNGCERTATLKLAIIAAGLGICANVIALASDFSWSDRFWLTERVSVPSFAPIALMATALAATIFLWQKYRRDNSRFFADLT
jgi:hypothetical protein